MKKGQKAGRMVRRSFLQAGKLRNGEENPMKLYLKAGNRKRKKITQM